MGINGCQWVLVVFDRYIDLSIKGGKRSKRGATDALGVQIKRVATCTPIPKQWKKFIANLQNKTNLKKKIGDRRWLQRS